MLESRLRPAAAAQGDLLLGCLPFESLARRFEIGAVFNCPIQYFPAEMQELPAKPGQAVFDTRRNDGKDLARHQPITFKLLQSPDQYAR